VRIALNSLVLIAPHSSRAGVCAELLEDLLLHHDLVTSDFILEEPGRKVLEKFSLSKREPDQVAAFLRRVAVVVVPADLRPQTCAATRRIYQSWARQSAESVRCSSASIVICWTCNESMRFRSFGQGNIRGYDHRGWLSCARRPQAGASRCLLCGREFRVSPKRGESFSVAPS
jgi:hypothetical protein